MTDFSLADIDTFLRTYSVTSPAQPRPEDQMSTTPKKREHIGIKAKIYNSPESLSMEEAYHKVYSSRNRYGNRSEQPHDFSPNQGKVKSVNFNVLQFSCTQLNIHIWVR